MAQRKQLLCHLIHVIIRTAIRFLMVFLLIVTIILNEFFVFYKKKLLHTRQVDQAEKSLRPLEILTLSTFEQKMTSC